MLFTNLIFTEKSFPDKIRIKLGLTIIKIIDKIKSFLKFS